MTLEQDKKFRKLFLYEKRWAKHWANYNCHKAQNTHFMMEPAQKTYNKILEIENLKINNNYEMLNILLEYFRDMNDIEEKVEGRLMNHYYWDCIQYLERNISRVFNGEEIIINKIK